MRPAVTSIAMHSPRSNDTPTGDRSGALSAAYSRANRVTSSPSLLVATRTRGDLGGAQAPAAPMRSIASHAVWK